MRAAKFGFVVVRFASSRPAEVVMDDVSSPMSPVPFGSVSRSTGDALVDAAGPYRRGRGGHRARGLVHFRAPVRLRKRKEPDEEKIGEAQRRGRVDGSE
jgi:hypothetical protein